MSALSTIGARAALAAAALACTGAVVAGPATEPAPKASKPSQSPSPLANLAQAGTGSPFGSPIPMPPGSKEPQPRPAAPSAVQAPQPAFVPPANLPPPIQVWRLEPGRPLHVQLRQWTEQAGWQLEWKVSRSWIVPARAEFTGRIDEAIEKVVLSLTAEGKPLQLNIWEGNNVAEIIEVAPR